MCWTVFDCLKGLLEICVRSKEINWKHSESISLVVKQINELYDSLMKRQSSNFQPSKRKQAEEGRKLFTASTWKNVFFYLFFLPSFETFSCSRRNRNFVCKFHQIKVERNNNDIRMKEKGINALSVRKEENWE